MFLLQVTHIHSCCFHFITGVWTFSDLLTGQNVRIPQWHSLCFIFPLNLDLSACSVLYLSPHHFSVNCHATSEGVLTTQLLQLRPPNVHSKNCSPSTNHQGEFIAFFTVWEIFFASVAENLSLISHWWLDIWKLQLQESEDQEVQMDGCAVAGGSPHYQSTSF